MWLPIASMENKRCRSKPGDILMEGESKRRGTFQHMIEEFPEVLSLRLVVPAWT